MWRYWKLIIYEELAVTSRRRYRMSNHRGCDKGGDEQLRRMAGLRLELVVVDEEC